MYSILILVVLLISCRGDHSSAPVSHHSTPQKNVVLLLTDDQRLGTIRALGNPTMLTPSMDRLVQEGTSFTRATIMGSMVGGVCAPSRSMLLTGRSLFEIDPTGHSIDTAHLTLPQYLRNVGYHTAHIGKWHNGKESFARSFNDGAAIFFGGMSDHYQVPLHHFDPSGHYPNSAQYKDTTRHSTEIYGEAAVKFLLRRKKTDTPFFLSVAFQAPHDPRQVPNRFLDKYPENAISVPENVLPEHPFDNGELDIRDEWLEAIPRTEAKIKKHLRDYYGMISQVDEQVGRILDALRDQGLDDNTLVIFAGDNGLAIGSHGLMGKQNLYQHSIGVPLIFRGPEIPRNKKDPSPVYLSDIYAAVCEWLSLPVPPSVSMHALEGVDWDQQKTTKRQTTVHAYKNFQRAIISPPHKLIMYHVNDTIYKQLFHMKNDPFEIHNLAYEEHQKATLRQLQLALQEQLRAFGDTIDLEKQDWNLPSIMSWKEKMERNNPEALRYLEELAKSGHKE